MANKKVESYKSSANQWQELMKQKLDFEKSMRIIVDTYQHYTEKSKLDMKDIDDLVECIKYELYLKNNIISLEEYEKMFNTIK